MSANTVTLTVTNNNTISVPFELKVYSPESPNSNPVVISTTIQPGNSEVVKCDPLFYGSPLFNVSLTSSDGAYNYIFAFNAIGRFKTASIIISNTSTEFTFALTNVVQIYSPQNEETIRPRASSDLLVQCLLVIILTIILALVLNLK